jgi:hypothetical protein
MLLALNFVTIFSTKVCGLAIESFHCQHFEKFVFQKFNPEKVVSIAGNILLW